MVTNRAGLYPEPNSTANAAMPRRFRGNVSRFLRPAPLAVGKLTPEGRWLEVQKSLCRMLGYNCSELLTKTIRELTDPDDRPRQKAYFANIVEGKTDSYQIEKRYICQSGHHLWVTETVAAVRDEAGSCLHCVSLIQANELRRIDKLFEITAELSASAIATVDQKGKIAFTNAPFCRIFGYRQGELLGKSMGTLLPSLLSESRTRPFKTQPTESKCHWFGQYKDGTSFPAEVTLRAIETGRGTWLLVSVVDAREVQSWRRLPIRGNRDGGPGLSRKSDWDQSADQRPDAADWLASGDWVAAGERWAFSSGVPSVEHIALLAGALASPICSKWGNRKSS